MTKVLYPALLSLLLASPLVAQDEIRLQFKQGETSTTIDGTITGDQNIDYVLGASAGQTMTVELLVTQPNSDGTVPYFNILAPGSDGSAALFVGSNEVEPFAATVDLGSDGDYTVRVYQLGNAKDSGLTTGYELQIAID